MLTRLQAVAPLLAGRTEAHDNAPRHAVDQDQIEVVRQLVQPLVRDLIDLQLLTGCRSGDAATSNYQSFGCQVDTGADDFVITGNNFRNNINAGVNNGAGTGPTKLVATNI